MCGAQMEVHGTRPQRSSISYNPGEACSQAHDVLSPAASSLALSTSSAASASKKTTSTSTLH